MRQIRYEYRDGASQDEARIREIVAILAAGLERVCKDSSSTLDQSSGELDFSGELPVTTPYGRRPDRKER